MPGLGLSKFIDIDVSGSSDPDMAFVKFCSDQVDIGSGECNSSWTKEYNWNLSEDDWDKDSKIKKWAFADIGQHEVIVELKDGENATSSCFATTTISACVLF